MARYKVWTLTIDSESWLGCSIHSSRDEAWNELLNSSEWVFEESGLDRATASEDEICDQLGEENVYFSIEESFIDTEGLEEIQ